MMVEVEPDHAERRINTLQQHYKRRRLAEHDEEVYLTCRQTPNGPGRASQGMSWSRCSPHRCFFSSSIHSLGGYDTTMSALCFLYLFLKLVTELAIFIVEGILFHSDREEIPTYFQPCCLLSQVQWTCSTSCCQVGLVSGAPQQCCRFGMFIQDPDFCPSRIQQPQQKIREKTIFDLTLFCDTNFTKLKIILFLNRYREKLEQIDKELQYFFPKKLSL